jgi:uncharacterized membrane protein YadS
MTAASVQPSRGSDFNNRIRKLAPGIALSAAVAAVAWIIAQGEEGLFTYALIEPVVLAIVIGMVIRTLRPPGPVYAPGIAFTAKQMLEFGIGRVAYRITLIDDMVHVLRATPDGKRLFIPG